MKYWTILLLVPCLSVSCSNKRSSAHVDEQADADCVECEVPDLKPSIFNVVEKSVLFSEPSATSEKLINHKASEQLGYIDYLSVDPSVVVKVMDSVPGWYKIQVIEPYWLKDTHIGWVESCVLELPENAELDLSPNIDYHFLKDNQVGNMKNLYFSYYLPCDEASLNKVAKSFKQKYSPDQDCNIYIFDTKDLMDIMDKYPLSDDEYLSVADHFIYSYDFTGVGQYYPFQDIRYKNLGGRAWKKAIIE